VFDLAANAVSQAAENASNLGADPSKGFLVGGTSAGGNIAATIAHLARDEKLSPPLTGCHLMIPAICNIDALPEKYMKDQHSWSRTKTPPSCLVKPAICSGIATSLNQSAITNCSVRLFSRLGMLICRRITSRFVVRIL